MTGIPLMFATRRESPLLEHVCSNLYIFKLSEDLRKSMDAPLASLDLGKERSFIFTKGCVLSYKGKCPDTFF